VRANLSGKSLVVWRWECARKGKFSNCGRRDMAGGGTPDCELLPRSSTNTRRQLVAAAASKGFPFINKGTKEKKHLILLLLLLLLLLRDRDLCYSRAFQKSCVLVEELGAAVLNPSEKKERKEFSSSKVVADLNWAQPFWIPGRRKERKEFSSSQVSRSELGAAVLNPWEKKERKEFSGSKVVCRSESLGEERKEFSSSKGCRSLREAAIGQE
jgi:hypothetical protein